MMNYTSTNYNENLLKIIDNFKKDKLVLFVTETKLS